MPLLTPRASDVLLGLVQHGWELAEPAALPPHGSSHAQLWEYLRSQARELERLRFTVNALLRDRLEHVVDPAPDPE